jgi:hypothetical protein
LQVVVAAAVAVVVEEVVHCNRSFYQAVHAHIVHCRLRRKEKAGRKPFSLFVFYFVKERG